MNIYHSFLPHFPLLPYDALENRRVKLLARVRRDLNYQRKVKLEGDAWATPILTHKALVQLKAIPLVVRTSGLF